MEYIIVALVVAFVGYKIFEDRSKPAAAKKVPAKKSVKKAPSVAELKLSLIHI